MSDVFMSVLLCGVTSLVCLWPIHGSPVHLHSYFVVQVAHFHVWCFLHMAFILVCVCGQLKWNKCVCVFAIGRSEQHILSFQLPRSHLLWLCKGGLLGKEGTIVCL